MRRKRRFPIPKKGTFPPPPTGSRKAPTFLDAKTFLPVLEKNMLRDLSKKMGLPQSRLLHMAFDNELDQDNPFHYPCTLPTIDYIQGAYVNEGSKIFKFLIENFKNGTGRDMLMLCRRSIGIPDRETFMLGYRELLEQGMIKEVPAHSDDGFKPGYMLTITTVEQDKQEAKIREQQELIAREQEKLKKLRGET